MENLVNGKLTDAQKALASSYETTYTNILAQTGDATIATFRGAGLTLSDAVVVRYRIKCADLTGVSLKVTVGKVVTTIAAEDFEPIAGAANEYYIYFNTLPARQMREVIYAVVMCDGVEISKTATYSVESYVATKISDKTMAALLKAMMYYGDSAKVVLG